MRIIKLNATDSTNAYLKNVMLSEVLDDFTIVIANKQLKGRGQMGASWQSEAGKNLTFSILKKLNGLAVSEQFVLNIAVSTAVYTTLKRLQIPDLRIKWPNDILSGSAKICGILIENVLLDHKINSAIIGIGLNINQQIFPGVSGAGSLKQITGRTFIIDEVMHLLLKELKNVFNDYEGKSISQLKEHYESLLFRKDKPSTFKDGNQALFMGYIRGISDEGKLKIEVEDNIIRTFDLKEVQLMY